MKREPVEVTEFGSWDLRLKPDGTLVVGKIESHTEKSDLETSVEERVGESDQLKTWTAT